VSSQPEGAFDARRARRQILRFGVIFFGGVAALVLVLIEIYGYATVRDGWDHIAPAVTAIKWGGMVVLIWQWKPFIAWVAQRQRLSDPYRDYLVAMRWRVAVALLVLEILFGQNLLAHLLN
jgi:hypothetical protein